MIGIVDWRVAELERLGVDLRLNLLADEDDVLAEEPDVVIVATGGVPDTDVCAGADLAISGWALLSGEIKAGGEVLVYDDHGQEHGLQIAEVAAEAGAAVEIVTPERTMGVDVGGINFVPYARSFARLGVRQTISTDLRAIVRQGNRLEVTLGSEYGGGTETRLVDQVVVEHGTLPVDDLYFALKPMSVNLGEVDQRALIAGRAQDIRPNLDGQFQLFRIGDAVASRNVHAAILEGLRFASTL